MQNHPALGLILFLGLGLGLGISLAAQSSRPTQSSRPSQGSRPTSQPSADSAKKKLTRGETRRQGGYLGLYIVDGINEADEEVVMIESVVPGSDAEKVGFRAGDQIVSINRNRIRNGDQFIKAVWMTAPMAQRRRSRAGRVPRGRRRGGGRQGRRRNVVVVRRGAEELPLVAGLAELDVHPKVGDRAPDFTLKDTKGKTVRLSRRLGKKPLVLIFGSYT